jgi:hypothetical protein
VRVHLPRINFGEWTDARVSETEELATTDRFRVHELVNDPADADVVLFVQCHMLDWRLTKVRDHPTARAHWDKVMVYDDRARHWRSFPGVYVSTPASSFEPQMQRAWSYLRVPAEVPAETKEPDLLFSFVGSLTHSCRRPLFELRHPASCVERVHDFMFWRSEAPNHQASRRRYGEILSRSRFVLCPRGTATSSFRLYETIAAGRVPVIISDDWVPPSGPDWDSFSLRVPEREHERIVQRIEAADPNWSAMSTAARNAYAQFFAEDVMFHRLAELLDNLRRGSQPETYHTMARRALVSAARESIAHRASRFGFGR